jgi:HPt (histidine-containing phosphotransfer) domain-containing protein
MGEDFIQELVAAYLEDTPVQLDRLRQALQDGDAEVFRRSAHTIKSTSLNFGAQVLADRARALEETGRSGNLEGSLDRIEELGATFEEVRLKLKEMGYA